MNFVTLTRSVLEEGDKIQMFYGLLPRGRGHYTQSVSVSANNNSVDQDGGISAMFEQSPTTHYQASVDVNDQRNQSNQIVSPSN